MTVIQCNVTNCRYNDVGRCSLTEIVVSPGSIAVIPGMLEQTSQLPDGDWRAGYASEFEAYAAYAETHPDSLAAGALCQSYLW